MNAALESLARLLEPTFPGRDDAPLARMLLAQLANGSPVGVTTLARAADRDDGGVRAALARWPNVERDASGRVTAFGGLTLAPTAHGFVIEERRLHTWCAWDTLFLPALLDRRALVESTCPVTGADVRLTVAPDRVLASRPEDVRVSFPAPAATSTEDITGSFCCHVHFLAGATAAERWLAGRDGALALRLADAFELGRLATRAFAPGAGQCWRDGSTRRGLEGAARGPLGRGAGAVRDGDGG